VLSLGRIEALSDLGIDPSTWLALIDSHRSLGHVPPHSAIKPGTQERCEYKAPASTAIVFASGARAGLIEWALDGSPYLLVDAEEESAQVVAEIAQEAATLLGAKLVRERSEEGR
jgi:hypothetical protein